MSLAYEMFKKNALKDIFKIKCLWKKLTKSASIYLSKYSEFYIVQYLYKLK